jgi:hypothetical protein
LGLDVSAVVWIKIDQLQFPDFLQGSQKTQHKFPIDSSVMVDFPWGAVNDPFLVSLSKLRSFL